MARHASWKEQPQYQQAIEHIRQRLATPGCTEQAVVLEEREGWRTALLGLAPHSELPPHDHPHTRGILQVVEGAATLHHYGIVARPESSRAVLLEDRGPERLTNGQCSLFGRRLRNLHKLSSGGEVTIIFSIRECLREDTASSVFAIMPSAVSGPDAPVLAVPFPSRAKPMD
jgi:hypothetical protein